MKKKGIQLLPKRQTGDPRASALALVGQVLIIAIIVPTFLVPIAYDWLLDDAGQPAVAERISFEIALPVDGAANRGETRDGGDNRPVTDQTPTDAPPPPLTAPSGVPSTVPTTPATAATSTGGYGDIVGDGGPVRGMRPTFTDQRLWAPPSDVVVAPVVPLNRADTLRLMLQRSIVAYADSLDRYNPDNGRRPGDWTFNLGGKKVGIDQGMIRLGNFSLPTPILGMLALNNVQANPMAMERARRLDAMRSEIQQQTARQMRDDEFDRAVQALRQRREKERRDAQQRQQTEKPPTTPSP